MTPAEFHEACHGACLECPQFQGYDDDQKFLGGSTAFSKIPKKGMLAVYKFWKDDAILFEHGYYKCLPPDALEIFDSIEAVIEKAIKEHFQ